MYDKTSFSIGDQISFIYNGGSRPGAIRLVDVKEVGNKTIEGFDHYQKDDRRFSYDKIDGVTFIYKQKLPLNVEMSVGVTKTTAIVYVDVDDKEIKFIFWDNVNNLTQPALFQVNNVDIFSIEELKKVVNAL